MKAPPSPTACTATRPPKATRHRFVRAGWMIVVGLCLAGPAFSQYGRGPYSRPKFPKPDHQVDGTFTFGRLYFEQSRREPLGHGWNTDYPDSDMNLMWRMEELTTIQIAKDRRGQPDHMVLQLEDENLHQFPFLFASDVGTAWFNPLEAANLKKYLLSGGFLWVDDFWGEEAWAHWASQIGKALPANEYPIVDLPLTHPLFHSFFTVREVPQVPSIQHWRWSGGGTSERGSETEIPHMRAIFDENGHMLVLMSHNTDIADGWEREGESDLFFELFSVTKSYPVGVNVVIYTMTH